MSYEERMIRRLIELLGMIRQTRANRPIIAEMRGLLYNFEEQSVVT